MNPESFNFQGSATETDILPVTFLLLVVASALILMLPRKYVALPFLFASLIIPLGQVVVVAGLHFHVFRILILAGWVRVVASGMLSDPQKAGFTVNSIDRAVIGWVVVNVIAFTLLSQDTAAFINRMGFAYTAMGAYFLARFLIRDGDDVDRVLKLFSYSCATLAVFMILEQQSGRNVFAIFGGVPELTGIRGDRIRAQGPFAHPIIAGTLGATLFPLFFGMLWWAKKSRMVSSIGMVAALVMTITSSSATPLLALAAGIAALLFWPFRNQMRPFRWGLVIMLVGLHMVMQAPVWALIARINVIGGSSDHRYELVNRTILHFWDWWLLGARDLESWGYLMHDTVNEYVGQAVNGGLLGLTLFITILVRCFRCIGLARKAAEKDPLLERGHWALGAWLFANVVAFFGNTYFDQTIVTWYVLLAMISAATVVSAPARDTLDNLVSLSDDLKDNNALPVGR